MRYDSTWRRSEYQVVRVDPVPNQLLKGQSSKLSEGISGNMTRAMAVDDIFVQ